MRIDLSKFGFEAPQGFHDRTNYSFKARRGRELLAVAYGRNPKNVTDADSLMADRRAELEQGMNGLVKVEGEGRTIIDGLPARTLTFGFDDEGVRYVERWAMTLDTPDTYIQIAYVTAALDSEALAKFEHIISSASRRKRPSHVATPQYIFRWAGQIYLDVPESLEPPRTYLFVSPDERSRLKLSRFDRLDSSSALPTLEQEIETDQDNGGTVSDKTYGSLPAAKFKGYTASYSLIEQGDSGTVGYTVRWAQLILDDEAVYLCGRAPSGSEQQLDSTFSRWLDSINQQR